MRRVLIVDPIAPAGEEVLARQAEVVRAPDSAPDTTRSLAADCDGIITRSKLPDDVFEAAPRVRAVAIHGTGIDLVPLQAATARGDHGVEHPGRQRAVGRRVLRAGDAAARAQHPCHQFLH